MSFVAERRLLFAEKNNHLQKVVLIRVSAPYVVEQSTVEFPVNGVIAGCDVEFEGLDRAKVTYYGMDSVQALNLATDLEPLIRRLSDRYDFYWPTGEPYFDDEDERGS